MDEIIYELLVLKNLLENSTIDSNKIKNAIDNVTEIVALLDSGNTDALEKIYYLFVPGSDITKIAESNGWIERLQEIKERVSTRSGLIRMHQKRNPSAYFDNVKAFENHTYASMPGRLKISQKKWITIQTAYNLRLWKKLKMNILYNSVQQHLSYGDTQPAVVISVNPFVVAAYSDEMDAVVLLKFPSSLATTYKIKQYDRFVSINCYFKSFRISDDIFIGQNYLGNWTNFQPLIGDLLAYETSKLKDHKNCIPEFLWQYVQNLGEIYYRDHADLVRNGFWFINKKVK